MSGVDETWADIAQSLERENLALKKTCDELRERAVGAELELTALRSQLRNWGAVLIASGEAAGVEMCASDGTMNPALAPTIADLRARLARYEAPGPALLTAEHERHCPMAARGFAGNAGMCECSHGERKDAYREQHARCVAVVEMMRNGSLRDHEREMLDEVIAALTDDWKDGA